MTAPTPAQLLADNVVLTAGQTATVLGLTFTRGRHKGEPNRHLVAELVADGRLCPVDPSQPLPRWTFSVAAITRYLDGDTAAPVLTIAREAS